MLDPNAEKDQKIREVKKLGNADHVPVIRDRFRGFNAVSKLPCCSSKEDLTVRPIHGKNSRFDAESQQLTTTRAAMHAVQPSVLEEPGLRRARHRGIVSCCMISSARLHERETSLPG
jgi:hypothetical protein